MTSTRRPTRILRALALIPALGIAGTVIGGGPGGPAHAAGTCSLVASPAGSDSATGTETDPLRTAQRLIDLLQAGQSGCLRAGTYAESLRFNHGGAPGANVTLTSYPGERATVTGRLYVPAGSTYVTVDGLSLDGTNASGLPSPTVYASDVTFSGNDVTNYHTGICFDLGNATYGSANRASVVRNRIHGCGRVPATNHDHGIYAEDASYATISWNLIYDNTDRGINVYPNFQNSTISHNVIDGNGEGILFSGDFGVASSNNTVAYNVLSDAAIRTNVESWYPSGNPIGTGNMVDDNCLWAGATGSVDNSSGGYTLQNNTTADPQFTNRAGGDFHMATSSPCAGIAGDVQGTVDGTGQAPPATTTTTVAPATTTTTVAPATTTTTVAPATTTTTVAPVADTQPPVLSAVTASVGRRSTIISWTTDEPADSKVDYWASTTTLTATSAGLVTSHRISLSGLALGTTYSYRVRSADAAGNIVVSPTYSFTNHS